MATVLLLRHRQDAERFPPVRLTLTGATLVTDVGRSLTSTSIQALPSHEAAQEHLQRVLRLRRDEGYRVVESGEIADEEVEPIADPIRRFFRYEAARRRADVDFVEGPISPEEIAEVVARLETAAPVCVDHMREDAEIPGGVFGAALVGKVLPSVKALVFSNYTPIGKRNLPPLDDLADFFAALPNLERVDATGRFALREARHGALCELHVEGTPLLPGVIAALGDGSLPALSTLDLVLGEDHGLDQATAAALRSVAAPRLRTIQVAGLADVTPFLAELTERPLPASWAMLYVRGSVGEEDELLAVLQGRAPALASVAVLGLSLADELSEDGIAKAKALLPQLTDVSELPDLWPPGASDAW
jgi:hypothetical protein